jgi:O-antigen ligase
LEYFKFIPWLPHSYDQGSSWQAFCNYLALALTFWAARDWFIGKSAGEERAERSQLGDPRRRRASLLPERMRRLLWFLTVNGGLLGVEGILQRLDGTAKLLFFRSTHDNPQALSQFGPYAYRSNAAQYFNLLWPVSVSLWWSLERAARRGVSKIEAFGVGSRQLLLVFAMIMAACPLISVSRVGAVVAVVNLAVAVIVIWSAQGKEHKKTKLYLVGCLAIILGVSATVSWNDLAPRFESENFDGSLEARNRMYDMARPMADASPLFGTGPGTFEPLFQMFRPDPEEYWPAQLHNDWLETLITFGWLGMALIAIAFATVIFYWFVARGIRASAQIMVFFWAAVAGCLFYARYDFPFQIYSITFLFVILCAAMFTFSHEM